jgi:uncharacterized membrane protein
MRRATLKKIAVARHTSMFAPANQMQMSNRFDSSVDKDNVKQEKETALNSSLARLEVHYENENKIMNYRNFAKKVNFDNVEKWLGRKVFKADASTLLLGLAVVTYGILLSYFTLLKHNSFQTYAWDLGMFNQSFWTTLHDERFFYSTVELLINPSGSFFGTHFSPIILLLLPVYALYPTPQSLLVFQSFVLALGAVPLYKLAKHVGKYRIFALSFVFAYMLYPPLQGINWFDFHVQSFLPLFFFSVLYFFETQNWKPYFLFIFLSLMVEEHATIIVVFVGLFAFLQHRKHLLNELKNKNLKDTLFLVSFLTIASGVLWYVLAILFHNTFFPTNQTFISTFKAASNWRILGTEDPITIPFYVFLHPVNAIAALSYDSPLKVSYLIILFGPLAFLSLSKMRYLLPTLPWFVYALFSNYQPYYLILFQYPAYVIAFIFAAAVYGIGHGGASLRSLEKRLAILLAFSFIACLLVSPFGPTMAILHQDSSIKTISQRDDLIHQLLSYIPQNASVITDNAFFPHVSSRSNAYVIPTISPVWTDHETEGRNFTKAILEKVEYLIVDTKTDPLASSVVFSLMEENPTFKLLASADSVVLFKKGYVGNATILVPYDATYDYSSLNLYTGELTKSPNSTSEKVLHCNGTFEESLMFWYSPRNPLPPGDYNITMKVRINITDVTFGVDVCADSGQKILLSKNFSSTDFAKDQEWTNLTILFYTAQPLADFEVKTVLFPEKADIYLDYVDVKQINPP